MCFINTDVSKVDCLLVLYILHVFVIDFKKNSNDTDISHFWNLMAVKSAWFFARLYKTCYIVISCENLPWIEHKKSFMYYLQKMVTVLSHILWLAC